ncbi:hypothetical protein MarSH_169 [Marseillevirus Shanghai 1]|nr:hypothetical protein MarSH_169 [Marseillevirus Shanghai 1]
MLFFEFWNTSLLRRMEKGENAWNVLRQTKRRKSTFMFLVFSWTKTRSRTFLGQERETRQKNSLGRWGKTRDRKVTEEKKS